MSTKESPQKSDRTWPLPTRGWNMRMEWRNLLFMHYPVEAGWLRDLIPKSLDIDTYDGSAWIGIVPFEMTGIRARYLPPIPGTAAFPELNVRTYVTVDGKPGVWFFSLDAAHRLAVWAARTFFHLAYFNAEIDVRHRDEALRYRSLRTHRGAAAAEFVADYRPVGDTFHASNGTFDFWLTARYCLYAANRQGKVFRGEIDHAPWSLQKAEAELHYCSLTEWLGFELPETEPVLHFARYIDVVAWTIESINPA